MPLDRRRHAPTLGSTCVNNQPRGAGPSRPERSRWPGTAHMTCGLSVDTHLWVSYTAAGMCPNSPRRAPASRCGTCRPGRGGCSVMSGPRSGRPAGHCRHPTRPRDHEGRHGRFPAGVLGGVASRGSGRRRRGGRAWGRGVGVAAGDEASSAAVGWANSKTARIGRRLHTACRALQAADLQRGAPARIRALRRRWRPPGVTRCQGRAVTRGLSARQDRRPGQGRDEARPRLVPRLGGARRGVAPPSREGAIRPQAVVSGY